LSKTVVATLPAVAAIVVTWKRRRAPRGVQAAALVACAAVGAALVS